jgi:preprotein translocase subunit SecY
MVSAAEQMAANTSWAALGKASDLRNRILFTLGLLIVYRLGTFIPVPGIDGQALRDFMEGAGQGIGGILTMFTGGALGRMGIFALGIMPYISASIIVQLLASMVPALEQMKKEGEQGRKKMNQWTRYGTVFLATLQSYGLAKSLEAGDLATDPGFFFVASTMITLIGGTMFLMWLGEQITARGIGNGISLIIFAGIVAGLPSAVASTLELGRQGALATPIIIGIILLSIVVIALIVFMERAQRRLLIQYPKRNVGNRMFEGNTSFLPLKLNTAGVIPPIFASSLLLVPATLSGLGTTGDETSWLTTVTALLGHGQPLYMLLYAALIVFFCFFYTAIVFNPSDTADNLKKHGGFIPGFRPGERTAQYIDYVLTRITVVGAIYIVLVCLLPEFLISATGVPFYFGGTSLLIIVSVTMDTVSQIQGHLLAHQYEGLVKKAKLRGKRR